jgi:hypothetical protein
MSTRKPAVNYSPEALCFSFDLARTPASSMPLHDWTRDGNKRFTFAIRQKFAHRDHDLVKATAETQHIGDDTGFASGLHSHIRRAANGEPDLVEKVKKGYTMGDKTYKIQRQ